MARHVTPAQYNAILRRAEAEQRQAVSRYNQAARQENARRKRAVDEYNRQLRAEKRQVDDYNRRVKIHNSRVETERRRLANEFRRLEAQPASSGFVVVERSTLTLHGAYQDVEAAAETNAWGSDSAAVASLSGSEAANSAAVTNALLGNAGGDELGVQETAITDELSVISDDLDSRWRGALYALDPRNPDAARHFCTSSREILVSVLDAYAPDETVVAKRPGCVTTPQGKPVRREKVAYLLDRSGLGHDSLETFVDSDVEDVVSLFRVFNDGTHGSAGNLDLPALLTLQRRVEGAIAFVSTLVRSS